MSRYIPHHSVREQYRHTRQIALGTLPPEQCRTREDYQQLVDIYLAILQRVMDDAKRIEYDARLAGTDSTRTDRPLESPATRPIAS